MTGATLEEKTIPKIRGRVAHLSSGNFVAALALPAIMILNLPATLRPPFGQCVLQFYLSVTSKIDKSR